MYLSLNTYKWWSLRVYFVAKPNDYNPSDPCQSWAGGVTFKGPVAIFKFKKCQVGLAEFLRNKSLFTISIAAIRCYWALNLNIEHYRER